MVCVNCGKELPEGSTVCFECGAAQVTQTVVVTEDNGAQKSKLCAALLAFFLGFLGIHDFYLGYIVRGVVKVVLTFTGYGALITGIWALVDFISILIGTKTDAKGRPLK